jgi:hypothetical protein
MCQGSVFLCELLISLLFGAFFNSLKKNIFFFKYNPAPGNLSKKSLPRFFYMLYCAHMHVLRDYPNIRVPLPKRKIYKRLGFKNNTTLLDHVSEGEIDEAIERAADLITLRGRSLRLPLSRLDHDSLELDNSLRFVSTGLARMFTPCQEALLMAATAGSAIMEKIKEQEAHYRQDLAVILDAVAGELVDQALSWIMELQRRELLHEGKSLLSRRYSAGYGDFSLENQIYFYNLLQLGSMGVTLTESYMLVPEKTVTALTGILKISLDEGDQA